MADPISEKNILIYANLFSDISSELNCIELNDLFLAFL